MSRLSRGKGQLRKILARKEAANSDERVVEFPNHQRERVNE